MCIWEPLSLSTTCARWKWVVPLMDETWGQVERAKKEEEGGRYGASDSRGVVMMERGETVCRAAEPGCIYIHLTDREVWLSRPPAFSFTLSLLPWPGMPEGPICCSFFLFSCIIYSQTQKVGKPWCQMAPGGSLEPGYQNKIVAWDFPERVQSWIAHFTIHRTHRIHQDTLGGFVSMPQWVNKVWSMVRPLWINLLMALRPSETVEMLWLIGVYNNSRLCKSLVRDGSSLHDG